MEMEFRKHFAKDLRRIIMKDSFKSLDDNYSVNEISIDFKVGKSRMENNFEEALSLIMQYSGLPAYN